MSRDARSRRVPLPSFRGAGAMVGGFLAGLDQLFRNRPPIVATIEEHQRRGEATGEGFTLSDVEPLERREPPDRSGARL